jgi:hypothetical protein
MEKSFNLRRSDQKKNNRKPKFSPTSRKLRAMKDKNQAASIYGIKRHQELMAKNGTEKST